MEGMRYAVALGILGAVLAWGQEGFEPQERLRMAQTLEALGDHAGAARLYEQLCQLYPDSVSSLLGLTRTLIRLQRYTEALARVSAFVRQHPLPAALAQLGELYWRLQHPDSARWAWQEALRRAPREAGSYRAVALAQAEVQLIDEAIATLQQGRRRLGLDTLFADELSLWYVRLGEIERGVWETLQLLQQWRDLQRVRNRLALYLALPEAATRMRTLLERAVQQFVRDTLVPYLLIWFLQEIGEQQAAFEQVRRLDKVYQRRGMELLQFADAARQNENFALALRAYQEVLQQDPVPAVRLRALYGFLQAAEQLAQSGTPAISLQQIRRQYEMLLREADTLPLGAELHYALGRFLRTIARDEVAARESFQRLIERFPQTPWAVRALVELAHLALRQNQLEQVEGYLRRAMSMDTLEPEGAQWARFWWGELQFFQGRWDSARAAYTAVALQTKSPAANDAVQRLMLFEQLGDSLLLHHFAEAERAMVQERFARAQAEYLAVVDRSQPGEPVRRLALLRAAEAAHAQAEWNRAQQLLTRLLSEEDDILYGDRALMLLGDILERQERYAEAIAVYQRFLLRYADSIYERQVARRLQRLREGSGL